MDQPPKAHLLMLGLLRLFHLQHCIFSYFSSIHFSLSANSSGDST